MAPAFGYAFLAAALLTVIGIVFAISLIQKRYSQAGVVVVGKGTSRSSELRKT
jgi:hypothetical protein